MLCSIIIPTYNEAKNIGKLIRDISKVMSGQPYKFELIVVDDNSPDGTAEEARKLTKYPVRVICRKKEKGLSSAVLRGFKEAKGDIVGVIDADFSHPPEKIPEVIEPVIKGYDISVGSRLVKGGEVEEWPVHRKLISFIARMAARPLTSVKDIMSGFFFLRKNILKGSRLVPRGYKILLEILVKCRYNRAKEVPYVFRNREVGESKLGTKVYLDYVAQLFSLYLYKLK